MSSNTDVLVPVVVETTLGTINVDINTTAAPITAANFLMHVDNGSYDGGTFHRTVTLQNQPEDDGQANPNNSVKIEVIQGGVHPDKVSDEWQPIPLERTRDTGLLHTDGAISMGRGAPDSAVEQFFFCIGDQPGLDFGTKRNPDLQGFAAFGYVTSGKDVILAIQQSAHEGQNLTPPVTIKRITRK